MTDDEKTLEAAIREMRKDAHVFFYREKKALRRLWCLDGAELDQDSGISVVVDLGGGTELQSDRLGVHLSALDWALLYAAREATPDVKCRRILVLDLRPGLVLNAFDTERSYLTNHVHYFAPSRGGGLDAVDGFVKLLMKASVPEQLASSTDAAAAFRSRWLASLARSDTRAGHHELNNSLGPMLLALGDHGLEGQIFEPTAGDEAQTPRDIMTTFTRQVMRKALAWACPTKPPLEGLKAADWTPAAHCGEVRCLLLDDQADEGWLPVLTRLLGLDRAPNPRVSGPFSEVARKGAASLWVATDAMAVLKLVWSEEGATATNGGGRWKVGKRLRLTASADSAGPFSEVLLLDLRLYARDRSAEATFFAAVAAAHESASGLVSEWKTRMDDRGFQQTNDYLEALTCFARLITEVDFTYPVVIWSSTGQRRVTEALKTCPNIYTALEKPRMDAYTTTPQDLQASFGAAAAIALRRVGDLVAAAQFAWEVLRDDQVWHIPQNKKHVEIYIDESSRSHLSGFRVGALVVYYASEQAAADLDARLDSKRCFGSIEFFKTSWNSASFSGNDDSLPFGDVGIRFTGSPRLPKKLDFGAGPAGPGYVTVGPDRCNDVTVVRGHVARELAAELKQVGAESLWLSVKSTHDHAQYGIDGRYPVALSECLKLLFSFFVRGPGRTASVYIATKQSEVTALDAREIFRRFGPVADRKKGRNPQNMHLYDVMPNHSAFLPVIDAHQFARGRGMSGASTLRVARGVTLSYKEERPRPAHYEWQLLHDIFGRPRDDLLHTNRPVTQGALTGAWRHMHYFADEMLESNAPETYSAGGAVDPEAIFEYDLQPDTAATPRSLADLGRALVWRDVEEAAKLYYLDVLRPSALEGRPRTHLEKFIGAQMRHRAKDRSVAMRMWRSLLTCISDKPVPGHGHAQQPGPQPGTAAEAVPQVQVTDSIHPVPEAVIAPIAVVAGDAIVRPYDQFKHIDVQRKILPPLRDAGWTGRPAIEADVLRFPGAGPYLALISQLLPPGLRAE